MATTNRDVELGISVTTAGSEGIKRLRDDVAALAKEGGNAAPEFNKLADELDRLGTQAKALEAFDQIGRDIQALSLAQATAAKTADDLSVKLAETSASADQFRQRQAEAKQQVIEASQALTNARLNLAEYKNSEQAAAASSEVYRARVRELTAVVIEGRRSVAEKSAALREATTATREAAAEESAALSKYEKASTEVNKITAAMRDKEQAQRTASASLRQLGVDTDDLTHAERQLVEAVVNARTEMQRIDDAHRQAAEAAKAQAREEERLAAIVMNTKREMAAAAQRELQYELEAWDRKEAAERQAVQTAREAAAAISNAMGTVGVKGANELRAEIQRVRDAMQLLSTSGNMTGAELDQAMAIGTRRIKELERQVRETTGQLTLMDRAQSMLKSTVGQLAAFITFTEIVQRLGSAFWESTKQIEAMRLGLGAVYKSAETAASQIDFLRKSADTAGVSVGSISDSFIRFSASMAGANIPLEQSNALFGAVSNAAGRLGLSGDKLNHILDALGQMAAKGVVSMEELRQQLGDSLPGAFSLAAKGMGITEAEMVKLVESGGLLAQDLFPALTTQLRTLGGEVNTANAAWERLKNGVTLTFQAIGDAGAITVLTGALKLAKAALDIFGLGLVTVAESVRMAFEGTGTFIGVLVGSGSLSEALAASGEKVNESTSRLIKYREGMFGAGDASDVFSDKMNRVTQGTAEQKKAFEEATAKIQQNTATMTTAGVQAEAAGFKTTLAGKNWAQLGIEMTKVKESGENSILTAEKLAKAKETEAKNTAELAKMTGDEVKAREAAVVAANTNAAALQSLSVLRDADLAKQIAVRDALIEEAARLGDSTGARTKAIEEIQKRINLLAAEADRSRQSAVESKNHAMELGLEAAAMQDNSSKLAQLKVLREQAAKQLEFMIELQSKGAATDEQVRVAREGLTVVERLYRDAVIDTTKALDAKIAMIRAEQSIASAKLSLERAQLETSLAHARQMGDEYRVREINIKLKELDIKVTRAKIQASNEETKATIDQIQKQLEELKGTDDVTRAKRAELEARLANAKAKLIENEASTERLKILEEEVRRLKLYGDTGEDANNRIRASASGASDGVRGVGVAAGNAADEFDRAATAAERLRQISQGGGGGGGGGGGTDLSNFSDKDLNEYYQQWGRYSAPGDVVNEEIQKRDRESRLKGNTGAVDNTGMFIIRDKLLNGTLTKDDAKLAQTVISAIQANSKFTYANPGASSLEGMADQANWDNIARRLEDWLQMMGLSGGAQIRKLGDKSANGVGGNVGGSNSVGGNRTINLQINGGSTTPVTVASSADAAALEKFLQTLSAAKGTTV